jgi:branched-subunit amino acid aminotransferase/4-amino-4-deoxychorismate lyase
VFLLYNGKIIAEEELSLPVSNRAFQYSDGFFETIIFANRKPRFWADHLARMQEACAILRLEFPEGFLAEGFLEQVLELGRRNECGSMVRVKLQVWRAGQGLYTPQTNHVDWLVTTQPFVQTGLSPLKVGICQTIATIFSPFSGFKGINAPVYVLASLEKQDRSLDDLLLLDTQGHLAEGTYANLFWVKNQTIYTPLLLTGCLNGVMRRNVIRWAIKNNWQVQEGFYLPAELRNAEVVFTGNVTGLRPIGLLEGEELAMDLSILERLQAELLS